MTTSSRQYDGTFLECRDLRHQWELIGYYRENGEIRRIIQCTRCTTQRNDRWTHDGQRHPGHYNYVDGYQVDGGFDTYAVRREVIRRATIHSSIQTMLEALSKSKTKTLKVRRAR